MATINVLQEILTWSSGRPDWQRDALRRLVRKGEIDDTDILELANLCKAPHGLGNRIPAGPLSAHHLPQRSIGTKSVSLASLTHHAGVNALAREQTVHFGRQLTVVYGGNAAGKSGYTRILKRVCRTRGYEDILGNVIISGAAPGRPSATIKCIVDDQTIEYQWDDSQPPDACLTRISVFDRHCASVYLAQPTDVAFRPLGLDLFDKLAFACGEVRKTLEKERRTLEAQKLHFPEVEEGTAVHDLVTRLTPLTAPTDVTKLASLSADEKARIKELHLRIRDLQSDNPEKTASALELLAERTNVLITHINAIDMVLSDTAIHDLFAARDRMSTAQHAAEELRRTTFHDQPLEYTGSSIWRALWKAAERFSTDEAYPSHAFPFTEDNARCVLCQQRLARQGADRLRQFQEFFQADVQADCDRRMTDYDKKFVQVHAAADLDRSGEQALKEIQLDDPDLANSVRACFDAAKARKESVTEALVKGSPHPEHFPEWSPNVESLTSHIEKLKARAKELRALNQPVIISTLKREVSELKARQLLADYLNNVLGEIERKQRIAVYQVCIDETKTNTITLKSSDLTRRVITDQLTTSFEEELKRINFRHVEVNMVPAGGSKGVLYHKLQFTRAPGAEVAKVVSDGEARCLSIASFFAELSTAEDQSAILFDDPVSSLDHLWRRNIAARLAAEADSRQVIVFTHDIVFLMALVEEAEKINIKVDHQYLRRQQGVAGHCSQDLPWAAMRVKSRKGYMNRLYQSASSKYRNGKQCEYERDASGIYGLLREAWERAVEEVLLKETVQRYGYSVQTKRARYLVDICDNDIRVLDKGMSKCSKWMYGHDSSQAENDPFPDPDELKQDLDDFAGWVHRIQERRK